MVILNQNVTIYIMFSYSSYLPNKHDKLHKQASEFSSRLELWLMVPNSTVLTVTAILRSRLLKMAAERKIHISLLLN